MKLEEGEKVLKDLGYQQDEDVSYCRVLPTQSGVRRCGIGTLGFTLRDIGSKAGFYSAKWFECDVDTFKSKCNPRTVLEDPSKRPI